MKIKYHVTVSLSLAALVWFFARSWLCGFISFAAGVLIDVDHIIEYIVHYGFKDFGIKRIVETCEETDRESGRGFKNLFLVFHMMEAVILLWLLYLYTKNIYVLAFSIGYSVHLIMDSMGNPLKPYGYFLIWRAIKGFKADDLWRKDWVA